MRVTVAKSIMETMWQKEDAGSANKEKEMRSVVVVLLSNGVSWISRQGFFDETTGEVEVFKGIEHRKERPGVHEVWNELGPMVYKVAADDAVRKALRNTHA